MRSSMSVWSRSMNRLFGTPRTTLRRKAHRRAPARRHGFERLEDRTVLSATFGSALSIGSTGVDNAYDVATDLSGNTILAGSFSGTVDLDPAATHAGDTDILTAGGAYDIYFAKYATDGSLLWAKQMSGMSGTSGGGRTVATDASGNVYLGGDFTGTVSFGTYSLTSSGSRDGFAAKIDANGTVLWANRWGGADVEYVNGIAVDGAGNVVATGSTTRYNTNGSVAYTNLQIEKFSAGGAALWAKQIGNTNGGNEVGNGIGTDTTGNIYVGGGFKGTVDFDPSSKTNYVNGGPNDSAFVLKLTAAGNFSWVSPFISQTSASHSKANDLVVDANNNIIVGGYYYGSVDFNPGKGTYTLPTWVFPPNASGVYSYPGFITKLNSAGSLIWAQQVGSGPDGGGSVTSLALDTAGNIYTTGHFARQTDFDPGVGTNILTSNGLTDVFVAKFSAAGTYQWAVSVGGTRTDLARGIAVDAAGSVYVAGSYFETVDFDPDPLSTHVLTSMGSVDSFLLKLRQV